MRPAYQISRLVRNAFAHAPFSPTWSIDPDCRHYGRTLALFGLCRFVRTEILKDVNAPRTVVPIPQNLIYQVGDLILRKEEIPAGAVRVDHDCVARRGILRTGQVAAQVPEMEAPRRLPEQLCRLLQVLQPANALLGFDRHSRGMHFPLQRIGVFELAPGPKLDRRQPQSQPLGGDRQAGKPQDSADCALARTPIFAPAGIRPVQNANRLRALTGVDELRRVTEDQDGPVDRPNTRNPTSQRDGTLSQQVSRGPLQTLAESCASKEHCSDSA